MAGNRRQNAGPPEVEWLATGAEYRDTGAECRPAEQSTGTQEQNAGQRELNRRIWEEKSAQLWGLRAFTICFAARPPCGRGPTCWRPPCRREQSCRVRGFTYRLGRDVADCLCRLPVLTAVPTAWANLPDAAKGRAAGPDGAGGG